jgi:hypothetical protein
MTGARRRVRKTQVVAFADALYRVAFIVAGKLLRARAGAHPSRAVPCLAGRGIAFLRKG